MTSVHSVAWNDDEDQRILSIVAERLGSLDEARKFSAEAVRRAFDAGALTPDVLTFVESRLGSEEHTIAFFRWVIREMKRFLEQAHNAS